MAEVRILGLAEVELYLRELQAAAASAGGGRVLALAGSTLPYAFGIETGYSRSGRLARRAGGAFMLTHALAQMTPKIVARLAAALPQGPEAVRREALALMTDLADAARPETPVVSGNLRRSLFAEEGS